MVNHKSIWTLAAAAVIACAAQGYARAAESLPYTPVITPNGSTLKFEMDNGVKVFRMTVEECDHEIAPGMMIKAWCYNKQTPGPTIEAVEGDRVRILVTNKLPEGTAVHWHGLILPSGMDGVSGLSQTSIAPDDTYAYEFTLRQHGTQMYHSHGDEMVQMGLGTMGFFVIHPKKRQPKIDRDYAIFLNEMFVDPGSNRPNPNIMTDFNIFTFNGRAFPGTAPLAARPGDRVRVRIGNVAQDCHPIHLHGHSFNVVATDGGDIKESAQWPETTVTVCPGQTRDFEFVARAGDWAMHCHKRHHPMNPMGHEIPNMIGVSQKGVEKKVQKLVPNYMAMGETGMDDMMDMGMPGPENTLPMMGGDGPFGMVGMGGMFTIVKIHDDVPLFADAAEYTKRVKGPGDLGWYKNAPGTVARSINKNAKPPKEKMGGMKGMQHGMKGMGDMKEMEKTAPVAPASGSSEQKDGGMNDVKDMKGMKDDGSSGKLAGPQAAKVYACPMGHYTSDKPGKCPKCGMTLKLAEPEHEDHDDK